MHGLDPDRIVCGVGSDEIIAFLCQAYAGPGTEVIHTEHGFGMYRISALAAGATPVEVRERERRTDVDAILAACGERTALVFVANPNNPTGTMIAEAEVARLAAGLPPQALLVLDGAYAEFVGGFDGHARAGRGARQRGDDPDLLEDPRPRRPARRLGLRAGARDRRAEPGARAVQPLDPGARRRRGGGARHRLDRALLRGEPRATARGCGRRSAAVGVPSDASTANFVLARFRDRAEAEACDRALREAGIIVRKVAGYKLPAALRITVGDAEACGRVAEAVGRFMRVRA